MKESLNPGACPGAGCDPEDLEGELELDLGSSRDRLGTPETVPLTREQDVLAPHTPGTQDPGHRLGLVGRHNGVLVPLEEQDRAGYRLGDTYR
jgi:hypothetical protein